MNARTRYLLAKLAEVRRLRHLVERQMELRANLMRSAFEKDPERKPVHHVLEYKHQGHRWLCVIHVEEGRTTQHALYWWIHRASDHARYSELEAILLRGSERPLHFDTHFFKRYGKRHLLLRDRITNLFAFFKQHYAMPLCGTGLKHRGQFAFAGAVPEGLVHAVLLEQRLISCSTFLDHDHMRPEERALWLQLMHKRGLPAEIKHPAAKDRHLPGDGRVVHW